MKDPKKRRLLAALAAGGGVVATLPKHWKSPVVNSVLLPAHATLSGCLVYAVNEIQFDGNEEDERLSVCAVVCEGVGQVRHQTSFLFETIGRTSFVRRDGQVPVGGATGSMVATAQPPCGVEAQTRQATLTNQSDDSITYTLIRGGAPLVVVLPRVAECPSFRPIECVL